MATTAITPRPRNAVSYYWHGEGPLWRIFWLWGVLGSWCLFAIFALAVEQLGLSWPLFLLTAAIMVPYTTWIIASVWQCAGNTRNDAWSNLARFLTGIWALNIGVVGGFLLVELLSA